MMGEGNHTLRFSETEGMWVGASVVCVIPSLAVVAVFAGWAVPDSVGRVDLFAEMAAMGKWKGFLGAAGRHFLIVVLRHGVPPEAVITSVFYSRG